MILHEHGVLTEEILAGLTSLQNWLALSIAVFGALVGAIYQTRSFQLFLLVPPVILIFVIIESNREFQILYLAMYVGLLEQRVNKLAGESLLLWEHSCSGPRMLSGRFSVSSSDGSRRAWFFQQYFLYALAAALLVLFLFSLAQAGWWLVANLPLESQMCRLLLAIAFGLVHIALLSLLLFDRFVEQPKVLSVIEDTLRERMLGNRG